MIMNEHKKVTSKHLSRSAYLYIRQSSLKQVVGNQESTKRQYALRNRAVALGWCHDQIIVIDSDQGQSGAESIHREGFQKLVAEVGMGKAGIVMGLEVSRLARNSTDWHRLLEICALTDTLILDEDGIYDPGHFNDRLLLGLKGTMSEAELHVLKTRLRGGVLNKARRGELKLSLPIGFIYDSEDRVIFHPDKQVQDSIKLLFKVFGRTGSAYLVVKYFRENSIKFPRKPRTGPGKGELVWGDLQHNQVLHVLHNPRYAGIFFYGRTQAAFSQQSNKKFQKKILDKSQWHVFLPGSHPAYITQEQYELNQRRLLENAQTYGLNRKKSPPREGPALLQGIVICGICGSRMTIRYHEGKNGLYPEYSCRKSNINLAKKVCQIIPGAGIDQSIGDLLIKMMTPVTLEVALAVKQEMEVQAKQIQQLQKKDVERAAYEADLARRRYMSVDPQNRLVADSLEAEWNEKLRMLAEAQEAYEKNFKKDNQKLSGEEKKEILSLTTDFSRLWKEPDTPNKDRKRIVRLLIEDVTLIKNKKITVNIRFKGGRKKTLILPIPENGFMKIKTKPRIVREVDQLHDNYTYNQIASIFNEKGMKTSYGLSFTPMTVKRIIASYGLKRRYDRLRDRGFINRREVQKKLNINYYQLKRLINEDLIKVHPYGGHSVNILYEILDEKLIFEKIKTMENQKMIKKYLSIKRTDPKIVNEIDQMLNSNTYKQIASIFNDRGKKTCRGKQFTSVVIQRIRFVYGLKLPYDRLREKGFLSLKEVQKKLKISYNKVRNFTEQGLIKVHAYADSSKAILYEITEKLKRLT